MIVGAQKAGTTALYQYLSRHPEVSPTKVKELHYFSCETRYRKGVKFYRSHFQLNAGAKLTFDASPSYLHNASAPERIRAHNPNIKIIILLRNPVERAYSAWNMYRERFLKNRNWYFDEWVSYCGDSGLTISRRQENRIFSFLHYALDEIGHQDTGSSSILEAPILSHGHYHDQIKRYLSLFSSDQLLILESSKIKESTVECLQRIEVFLRISGCDWGSTDLAPVFEGEYSNPIDITSKRLLLDYYALRNERLFGLLGKRYEWGGE